MAAKLTPPMLPAHRIACKGKQPFTAVWCPWCEQDHRHGDIQGCAGRAPHCAADPRSPLGRTGYVVKVVGEARSLAPVIPRRPLGSTGSLREAMNVIGVTLRRSVVRKLLGLRSATAGLTHKRTPAGDAWLYENGSWRIEPRSGRAITGHGLTTLAGALYGLPPGIAGLRLFEAVTGDVLDEEAAFGLQAVIEAWQARGAPQRPER